MATQNGARAMTVPYGTRLRTANHTVETQQVQSQYMSARHLPDICFYSTQDFYGLQLFAAHRCPLQPDLRRGLSVSIPRAEPGVLTLPERNDHLATDRVKLGLCDLAEFSSPRRLGHIVDRGCYEKTLLLPSSGREWMASLATELS